MLCQICEMDMQTPSKPYHWIPTLKTHSGSSVWLCTTCADHLRVYLSPIGMLQHIIKISQELIDYAEKLAKEGEKKC